MFLRIIWAATTLNLPLFGFNMTNEIPALSNSEFAGLRRVAARLLRDASSAEDIVQEAWIAASKSGSLPTEARRGVLVGIVRNLARNELRDRSRRFAREQRAARHEALHAPSSSIVEEQEVHRLLHQGVESLDEPLASALRGRFFENRSTAELAETSGMSESLIRHRIRSGLEQLKTRLGSSIGDTRAMGLALIGAFDWKPADVAVRAGAAAVPAVVPAGTIAWVAGLKWAAAALLLVIAALGLRSGFGASSADLDVASIDSSTGSRGLSDGMGGPGGPSIQDSRARMTADSQAEAGDASSPHGKEDEPAPSTASKSAPVQPVRVIDHAGAPVPNASIFQRGSTGFEHAATTGADGKADVVFTANMLVAKAAGRGGNGVGIVARAPSYAESTEYFIVAPPPGAAPLTLQLPGPGQTLTGTVFGIDGRPLAGALVVVDPLALENGENREPPFIPGPGGLLQRRLTHRAVTKEDGSFTLRGLTQTPHPILVTKAAHKPMQVYAGEADHAEAYCEVRMTSGGRVRGVVRDDAGEPAVGALVYAEPLDLGFGVVREAETDEEGRFDLNYLGSGRTRLRAVADGVGVATANIHVREAEEQSIQMNLAPMPWFEISLVDEAGEALVGFGIGVSRPDLNWNGGIKATNADGLARFVGFPDGELAVRILKRGIQSPISSHVLQPSNEGSYVVVSPREHAALGKLSGNVLVDSKNPPALSRVRINRIGFDSMMTTPILDTSGRFEVRDLPQGTYELMLQTPSMGLIDMATIELTGADYELQLVDLAPTGKLSIEWGWQAEEASTYRLIQRYSMDAGALSYDHFIAQGSAPPPSEFHVFEGDYEFIVSDRDGEAIGTTRIRVRPDFSQVLRLGRQGRIPGSFDIVLASAADQRLRLEVHALDSPPEKDATLDSLPEAELEQRISEGTRVHTLFSPGPHDGTHRFGCDVDAKRRWILSTQLASGRRFTFLMPRPEPEQQAWYEWTLDAFGPRLATE